MLFEVGADDRIVTRREGFGLDVFATDTASALGRFFVELHVRLHLPDPWGLVLTGILGLAMLAAAVSGLLMHRHLIRDSFRLRQGSERLVTRRDLHTVAGTWILPHAFVLAFTGAFYSFAISIGVPVLVKIAFNGDQAAMIETVFGHQGIPDPRPQTGTSLDTILADAYRRADAPIASISIDHWDRADSHLTIRHLQKDGALRMTTLTYSGATGAFLAEKPLLGTRPSIGEFRLCADGAAALRQFRWLVVKGGLVRAWCCKRLCHLDGIAPLDTTTGHAAAVARVRPADSVGRRGSAVCDGGFGHRVLRDFAGRDDVVLDACSIPDCCRSRAGASLYHRN